MAVLEKSSAHCMLLCNCEIYNLWLAAHCCEPPRPDALCDARKAVWRLDWQLCEGVPWQAPPQLAAPVAQATR